MPRALIFDVDGTLIDSVDAHAQSWQRTLAAFGHPRPLGTVRQQIGKGSDLLMKEFLPEDVIAARGEEIEQARKDLFKREYLPHIRAFPATRELFQHALAAGKRVVLASSAAGDELTTYKERAGVADLIDSETSKDDAEQSKPAPDIFEAALAKLPGIAPADALVIGDSPWDAIAARRAGIDTVGVLCGGFSPEVLRDAGCIALYDSPAQLLSRFDDSPLA